MSKFEFELVIFGSVVNGLQDRGNSDIDLTIIVDKNANLHHDSILQRVRDSIEGFKFNGLSLKGRETKLFWMSAGALLKVFFKVNSDQAKFAKQEGLEISVDIAVNKFPEILNSQLVETYCKLDKRFREAAIILKKWQKTTHTDPNKRLNSFSIYMLLLAYMIQDKFIPNL